MRKGYIVLFAAFSLAISMGATATAQPLGHLPPGSQNVNLVSKLQLTDTEDAIADVSYFKGFAYLNAWAPACQSNGGPGAGVHIVDVRDPANPTKVGFLPAHPNSHPGEGVHIVEADTPFFQGDILIHNNEHCDNSKFAPLGASIWDVTDPLNPKRLGRRSSVTSNFGDTTPVFPNELFHSIHSAQMWTSEREGGQVFAFTTDNDEFPDVDIFDLTNPNRPVLASEVGIDDWPDAQDSTAFGDQVFLHDSQFKRIEGNDFLLASYWDAGQVLLNVNDPYNPVFVGDSDFPAEDPLVPGIAPPEGNSHESYWSSDNQFVLSTDEDFSPYRAADFMITSGDPAHIGAYPSAIVPGAQAPAFLPDLTLNGPVVYGGYGCPDSAPIPAPEDVPGYLALVGPNEEKIIVLQRGPTGDPNAPEPACFPGEKAHEAVLAGWDAVLFVQRHGGVEDPPFCGSGAFVDAIVGVCTNHEAFHRLFNTPPFTGPYTLDQYPEAAPAIGDIGSDIEVGSVFDGWGYVQLHDATQPNLPIIASHAVPEALDPAFAFGFGDLSVHEVKTDPRPGVGLAYFSYYNAGFRVWEFDSTGMREVGFFIDDRGNDFWGVFPIGDEYAGHGYPSPTGTFEKPLILASDRDFGLYIFDFVQPT
jgi:hypothetical protein